MNKKSQGPQDNGKHHVMVLSDEEMMLVRDSLKESLWHAGLRGTWEPAQTKRELRALLRAFRSALKPEPQPRKVKT